MPEGNREPPPDGTMIDDLRPRPAARLARAGRLGLGLLLAAATAATLVALGLGGPDATAPERAPEAAGLEGVYQRGDTLYVPTGEVLPGVVFVDSRPDGLEVRLDGASVGRTPLVLDPAPLDGSGRGPVEVELLRDGRVLWHRQVPVVGGGLRVDVELEGS